VTTPSQRKLSVVVPTFNERDNIGVLVQQILDLEWQDVDVEIVVVDDSSTDGTAEVLQELEAKVEGLVAVCRTGPASLSRSWYEGFDRASGDVIVCIDADLCHDPAYFPIMWEKMGDLDVVIGSRYLDDRFRTMEGKSLLPVLASVGGQFLTRVSTGLAQTDISHSFRMFRKSLFDTIKSDLKEEGNVFLIEFLYLARRNGARIGEIPIQYGKRIHGETKLSVSKESRRYLRYTAGLLARRALRR